MLTFVKTAVFLSSLYPLIRLAWLAANDSLGANPIEFITRSTGTWTLVFLMLTLAITPLRRILSFPDLIKFRRMLGLFAFFYASLHFTTYFWLDQFFDLMGILLDVMKRPFITVGFLSFVLMVPLALTSTSGMIRRLGGRRWQWLHRLVYPVAVGGVIHYLWLVKADLREPLIYAAVLALLLGFRMAVAAARLRPGPWSAKKTHPAKGPLKKSGTLTNN